MNLRDAERLTDIDLEDDEVEVPSDNPVFWVYDPQMEWYTLSKTMHIKKTYQKTEHRVISEEQILKVLNAPDSKDLLSEYEILPNGTFLAEFITSVDEIIEKRNTLPKVELPKGAFKFELMPGGAWGLKPYTFCTDKYIELTGHTGDISTDIDIFLKKKEDYKKLNLLHKRGILLYGPPGTGKTMLIENITRKFQYQARIIFGPESLMLIKKIESMVTDVPLILVFEEFTQYRGESVLSFLDGENSINGCLIVGTTNYPQHIPANLIDRPGRFDSMYEVGLPSAETKKAYLKAKLGIDVSESIIKESEGLTLAYLRELIIASQVYDKTFADIFKVFRDRKSKIQEFRKYKNNKDDDAIWLDNVPKRSR